MIICSDYQMANRIPCLCMERALSWLDKRYVDIWVRRPLSFVVQLHRKFLSSMANRFLFLRISTRQTFGYGTLHEQGTRTHQKIRGSRQRQNRERRVALDPKTNFMRLSPMKRKMQSTSMLNYFIDLEKRTLSGGS